MSSALEVIFIMRCAILRFTYLLTYLLTYLHWSKRINVHVSLGELNFSVRYETYHTRILFFER